MNLWPSTWRAAEHLFFTQKRTFKSLPVAAMRWSLQVIGGGTHADRPGTTLPDPATVATTRAKGPLPLDSKDLSHVLETLASGHAISDGALATPVLALRFDSQSYLFNVPEATQRALTAQSVRLSTKLRHIFLTGAPDWTRWGGLPGFLLTVADALPTSERNAGSQGGNGSAANNVLHVHGGDGIAHCLGSMRWFVYRGSVSVEVEEYPGHLHHVGGAKPAASVTPAAFDFSDENLRVKVIAASSSGSPTAADRDIDMANQTGDLEELASLTGDDQAAFEDEERNELLCGGGEAQNAGFLVSSPMSPTSPSESGTVATAAIAGTKRKASASPSAERQLDSVPPKSSELPDSTRGSDHAYKKQVVAAMFTTASNDPSAHPLSFANPANKRDPALRRTLTRLPHHAPSGLALSYLILTPGIPGRFDPVKAAKLGIPKGPLFGQLMRGTPVELSDPPRTIQPNEVIGPSRQGSVLLVIDIPHLSYLPNFVKELQTKAQEMDAALGGRSAWIDNANKLVVIHMASRDIVENTDYWTQVTEAVSSILNPSTTAIHERLVHVLYHSKAKSLDLPTRVFKPTSPSSTNSRTLLQYSPSFAKSTGIAYRLSQIDQIIYPDPIELAATYPETTTSLTEALGKKSESVVPALPLLEMVLEPFPPKLDFSNVPLPFGHAKRELDTERDNLWGPLLNDFAPELKTLEPGPIFVDSSKPDAAVEVWPLGTGSAAPSKYRNVSSTLVVLPSMSAYEAKSNQSSSNGGQIDQPTLLLDCGESTMSQLYRLIPFPTSQRYLRNLRFVFLSHLHADHQLGLVGVLKERWRLWKSSGVTPAEIRKVVLVAPWKYRLFLEEYSDLEEPGSIRDQVIFVESESIVDLQCFGDDRRGAGWRGFLGPGAESGHRSPYTPQNIGQLFAEQGIPIASVATIPVVHCPAAFAGTLTTLSGFRVSFSGDCRPSQLFAQVARGSDVLVHEATFEDGLEDEAVAKRHCTVGEAVSIGRR